VKIGFLALSGIRAHDPKLLELGLTLPGFVERSKAVASLPSLGLLYLAACTPEGHDLRYFEAESDGGEPPEVYACDLVAISTFSAQIFEAYAIADRLRDAGVRVAMGGLHVSALPAEAAAHADYVVVGEGENVWPAVVAAAVRGEPGRTFRASEYPPVVVDALPVPRYDLLGDRPYNRFTVQTTRGCPWRCDFCGSNVTLGRPYRRRPVAHVVRDIEAVLAVRPHAFIEFADDNTFVDKRWGRELCAALKRLGIKWFTETDLSVANDPTLLDLLRESGCRQVLIGLESPTAGPLQGIEIRRNFKARTAEHYLESLRRIQAHGVTVNGCFILGLDGHTTSIFEEVLEFGCAVPLYDVQITILTAFPGTPLYSRLVAAGRVLEPGRWDLCTLFDVNYTPSGMSPRELQEGIYWLTERLYDQACTRVRRQGFLSNARRELRRHTRTGGRLVAAES
jgi:radical SAM superfamily enzyme YgiQ (UPF0313 family)